MQDIVSDYTWTTIGKQGRVDAPRIYASTFKNTQNRIFEAGQAYIAVGGSSGNEYYDKLHDGELADEWVFPFFTDEVRSFSNSWGDTYVGSTNGSQIAGESYIGTGKQLIETGLTTFGQAAGAFAGKPGALFEPPKYYQYNVDEGAVGIEFTLINTINEGDIEKNYSLVKKLITENRFERGSNLTSTPPVLWEVTVPGYRFIKWATAAVNINLIGRREYRKGKVIPEGYRVGLTFTSLYTEPNNFASKYISSQ
jgi:hypothetical protein